LSPNKGISNGFRVSRTLAGPAAKGAGQAPPNPKATAEHPPGVVPPASKKNEVAFDLGKDVKLEMVLIPAGEFKMGSLDSDQQAYPDEKPQHRVRITKPFYLGKYLVTQEQWQAVMGGNPSQFKGLRKPVDSVSWDDCQKFLDKLNAKFATRPGKFRLPSEAQWEYACRAESTTRHYFGDDWSKFGEYGWYRENSRERTRPVGQKKPNAWGLYDMHGNVWEWCADWWDERDGYYAHSPTDDPPGPATGWRRALRGGSWGDRTNYCRSASRIGQNPMGFYNGLGLRVCRVLADK